MAFTWTDDLNTGNPAIDAQHKQLISALNSLHDACMQCKGREELMRTSRFLNNYTIRHFADEEAMQESTGYPGYSAHKATHDTFRATMDNLAAGLEREGATTALVAQMNQNLGDWLIRHIKYEDKKLADHIRTRRI